MAITLYCLIDMVGEGVGYDIIDVCVVLLATVGKGRGGYSLRYSFYSARLGGGG